MTQPEALWLAHRLISMADDGDMGRSSLAIGMATMAEKP
jgi:hypothetical protein